MENKTNEPNEKEYKNELAIENYDIVYFSENPEVWERKRIELEGKMFRYMDLRDFLMKHLIENFKNFDKSELEFLLYLTGEEIKNNKLDLTGIEINTEVNKYITDNDYFKFNIKVKNKLIPQMIKQRTKFQNLLFCLMEHIGVIKERIRLTEDFIKILQGHSKINGDYIPMNIRELQLLKKPKYNMEEFTRILDKRFISLLYQLDEKENRIKLKHSKNIEIIFKFSDELICYLEKLLGDKFSIKKLKGKPLTLEYGYYIYVYYNRANPEYRDIDIYNYDVMRDLFDTFKKSYYKILKSKYTEFSRSLKKEKDILENKVKE